jgi:hypothetical protein
MKMKRYKTTITFYVDGIDIEDAREKTGAVINLNLMPDDMIIDCEETIEMLSLGSRLLQSNRLYAT